MRNQQKIIQYIHKYFLIILGLVIVLAFLWLRFIRKRLPRDIPFYFNIMGLFIIISLCLIYSFLIYSLLKKKKVNSYADIIKEILTLIYMPLELLDDFIKNYFDSNKIPYIFFSILEYLIVKTNIYYYSFVIFPRFVLISILVLDTFIFNQLFFIYKIIYIGLFLLFNAYFIYSLRKIKNNLEILLESYLSGGKVNIPYIYELYEQMRLEEKNNDPDYDDEDWQHEVPRIYVKLKVFLEYQLMCSTKLDYKLLSSEKIRQRIAKENNIDPQEFEENYYKYVQKTKDYLHKEMKKLLQLCYILKHYDFTHISMQKIKNIKLLIYTNYLLCWLYILIVSIHTLDINQIIIMLLRTFLSIQEPFSGIFIW